MKKWLKNCIFGRKTTKSGGLIEATFNGDLEEVTRLIELGATIDQRGYDGSTPLITACKYGHIDITKLLIKVGASVNQAGIDT